MYVEHLHIMILTTWLHHVQLILSSLDGIWIWISVHHRTIKPYTKQLRTYCTSISDCWLYTSTEKEHHVTVLQLGLSSSQCQDESKNCQQTTSQFSTASESTYKRPRSTFAKIHQHESISINSHRTSIALNEYPISVLLRSASTQMAHSK